jgi:hypothetical protein
LGRKEYGTRTRGSGSHVGWLGQPESEGWFPELSFSLSETDYTFK